jgi:hypothetical protein
METPFATPAPTATQAESWNSASQTVIAAAGGQGNLQELITSSPEDSAKEKELKVKFHGMVHAMAEKIATADLFATQLRQQVLAIQEQQAAPANAPAVTAASVILGGQSHLVPATLEAHNLGLEAVRAFKSFVQQARVGKVEISLDLLIHKDVRASLTRSFQICGLLSEDGSYETWKLWTDDQLFHALELVYPVKAGAAGRPHNLLAALRLIKFTWCLDASGESTLHAWGLQVDKAYAAFPAEQGTEVEKSGVDCLLRSLTEKPLADDKLLQRQSLKDEVLALGKPATIPKLTHAVIREGLVMQKAYFRMKAIHALPVKPGNPQQPFKKHKGTPGPGNKRGVEATATKFTGGCYGCGRPGHKSSGCQLAGHPEFNKEPVPFDQSAVGKRLAALTPPKTTLPWSKLVDGSVWEGAPTAKNTGDGSASKKQRFDKKGELLATMVKPGLTMKELFALDPNQADIVDVEEFLLRSAISVDNNLPLLPVRTLLDTGALQGNYASKRVAN